MKAAHHASLLVSASAFALGAYALWKAATANSGLNEALIAIAEADARGVRIDSLGHLATGLMAGGHPMVVPMWAVYVVGIVGLTLMWLGAATFLLTWRGIPAGTIFRISYWTHFQNTLVPHASTKNPSPGDQLPPLPRRKKKAG